MSTLFLALADESTSHAYLSGLEDCSVQTFSDGLELFRAASHYKPDLVVLEEALASLSGLAVARLLKHHQDTSHIRLLYLFGILDEHQEKSADACGVDLALEKPVDPQKFRDAVHSLLHG